MDTSDNKVEVVVNQHYDESVDVNDSEEVASLYSPTPRKTPTPLQASANHLDMNKSFQGDMEASTDYEVVTNNDRDSALDGAAEEQQPYHARSEASTATEGDSSEDGETSSDDDEDNGTALEGAYDPADYEDLNVTQDIKELFQYITRYTPQTIELEHKLKPFIPEYIPAVGDIDAFLKVPKPDNEPSMLGLTVLDEPCSKQSDPTVLDLQLRNISKMSGMKEMQVRSLENAQKSTKAIENWITSIEGLRRSKPPQNVHYTKSMPDIERLMQEWPAEFEELLNKISLPSSDMDCDLKKYIDTICSILDIPVYRDNRVQSLHVLFSLYMEFKNSQHFQTNALNDQKAENEPEVLTFD